VDIAIVGVGHVGLVCASCFASLGHRVYALDVDKTRIDQLRSGVCPFFEPDLHEVMHAGQTSGALTFHSDPAEALSRASLIFVCVNTSSGPDDAVDLSGVLSATRAVARFAPDGAVLVNRSTAPVGTARYVESMLADERAGAVDVAVNPEFLAEGTAVRDFMIPDRIVFGAWDERPISLLFEAYEAILSHSLSAGVPASISAAARERLERVPLITTSPQTAELMKYAANAFLAVRISFINEIASIADQLGADVEEMAQGIGLDHRIGPHFLRPGIGWGGSCFPKDIATLRGMAETRGVSARMLRAANEVNEEQRLWAVRQLQRHLKTLFGRRVGLLGLSFKPNTDDLRNAPAVEIAMRLVELGAEVRAFDPAVTALPPGLSSIVQLAADPMALARGADALVLATDWAQFGRIDLPALAAAMRIPLLLDGRNFFDPMTARTAGFTYVDVGRESVPPALVQAPRRSPLEQAAGIPG
jgi:UDPglucose 6-dehydrogenase